MNNSWQDSATIVQHVSDALNSFDWTGAETACASLIQRLDRAIIPFPEEPAKQILARLRKKRRFRLMERVADALIRSGQAAPQIRRQYTQAMIDQGILASPEFLLSAIVSDNAVPLWERAEARGLLGRIYKQLYVNADDPQSPRQQDNLRKAIGYYYEVYRSDPATHLWHGINAVALFARARRDEITVSLGEDERDLAQRIISKINEKPETDGVSFWDRATLVEANVALGNFPEAINHLLSFVSDPAADAFEDASLYRQLTEVWKLRPDSNPGSQLLPILQAAQLKREGGRVQLELPEIKAGLGLETVFDKDRYSPYCWYLLGLQRCKGVARIEDSLQRRVGSGFLLDPSDFFDPVGSDPLLLTNHHVISPADDPFPNSIRPENAIAVFEALEKRYRVKKLLWHSPVAELDASLVTLEPMGVLGSPCPLEPAPEPFDANLKQRVYVIGYPLGGPLSISLQDSIWLDTDDRVLHYRTPTDPGSSGSPVFDQKYWTVIGLHHKGKADMPRLHGEAGTYEANEAISIAAIREAIRKSDIKPS